MTRGDVVRRRPEVRGLLSGLCVAVLGLSGCLFAASDEGKVPERLLQLDFDDTAGNPTRTVSTGTADAAVTLLTANAPTSTITAGWEASPALRLPAYSGSATGSYAALKITPKGEDRLWPGEDDFEFGADVLLDEPSSGTGVDDGDNVLQRGLFEDAAQYKLQVDSRRPSCVVRGTAGEVVAKSDTVLRAGVWYRLSCHRQDDALHLVVTDLAAPDGAATTTTEGETGILVADEDVPLAVGAKIGSTGALVLTSTDQFNGALDDVHVTVLR